MERQAVTKELLYNAPPPMNSYEMNGGQMGLPVRSHYPQYSPLARHRSYVPQYSQYKSPRRPHKVFRYDCHYPLFAGDWGLGNYVSLSTFNENPINYIYVLHAQHQQSYDFTPIAEAKVTMPPTKVAWHPSGELKLLSSSDALRLWQLNTASNSLTMVAALAKNSKSQSEAVSAPLTSFDWNKISTNIAIVSSIDTTCSVWDLNAQSVTTQLIAHDQEVFDVAFLPQSQDQFVSAGCDGSVRLFDLRSLDNSTIIYESSPSTPMLRVAPSPHDPNVIAAFGQERNSVVLLDIRATRNPVKVLEGHQAPLNSIKWMPNQSKLLATGADDCQILLWDVSHGAVVGNYTEIQQVNTVLVSPDDNWLGSVNGKSVQAISTQLL